ncbi:MAG TPA: hypothetical protein VJ793_17595 [Anaerolineae bacterium]|nr:hypothetical protein [Anaerolineae bacterium]
MSDKPEQPEKQDPGSRSGGVNITGKETHIGGDVVGRDKIISPGQYIDTGGGAYIGGDVSTGGGKFVGRDDYSTTGLSGEEVARLFESIYDRIDARPNTGDADKADLKAEVKDVQAEAAKGEKADEGFLTRHLRNIGRMAPDILEVVLATLANPAVGLGMAAKKIAEKAKGAV